MTNKNNIKFVKSKLSLAITSVALILSANVNANTIDGIPSVPPAVATNNASGTLPTVNTNGAPTLSQQMKAGQEAPAAGQIMPEGLAQQQAPQSLPPLPMQNPKKPNSADLDSVVSDYMSMTPDEIKNIRQKIDARAKAASELPVPEPKPVTGSISVSLAPGSQPPVIRPFVNNTTIFVVIDSTGQPWPVENFIVGDDTAFTVKRFDLNPKGSSFAIVPKGMYSKTNVALKLEGQDTPIIINLIAGQAELDSRVEVRVQGRGPNASIISQDMVQGTDARLLPILDGIPPEKAKRLKSDGNSNTTVWMKNGRFIVRTPLKIISPASNSFVSSAEGNMNVYVINKVPQLRGIIDGNIVTVNISGY